jgi:hypothetical protein
MIKPGTQQAETGHKVQGQPGLHSETLSQKKKKQNQGNENNNCVNFLSPLHLKESCIF